MRSSLFAITVLLPLAFCVTLTLTIAAPRTLPCASYGACKREQLPSYRLFEMDFADPQRIQAWQERTGRSDGDAFGTSEFRACAPGSGSASSTRSTEPMSAAANESAAADCLSPIAQSWEKARRWCQSNGWSLYQIDGKTKVICLLGAEA